MGSWLISRPKRHHQETPSMIFSTTPTLTLNPKTTSQNNQVPTQQEEKAHNLLNLLNSNPEKELLYKRRRRKRNSKIRLVISGMKGMNLWICYLGVLLVGLLVSLFYLLPAPLPFLRYFPVSHSFWRNGGRKEERDEDVGEKRLS